MSAPEPGGGTPRFDRWIRPFLADPPLWPVTLVVIAHFAAFAAPLVLGLVRDPGPFRAALLLGLAAASAWACWWERRHRGGSGGLALVVAASWVLTGVGAWIGDRSGML